MEVIGNVPFRREVREWQRVDPNTGSLLTGRLEADRWISGPLNTYGKVVDSQNVSTPNGTQLSQRKQLEVLQARTSSGSLQVVRAHTVQTSSSRWSSSHHQHSTINSNSNDLKSIEHFTSANTRTNGEVHAAASNPHNNFKSVFQRKQLVEPQTKIKHISLPTEISTKLNVGVGLTQLDLTNERETFVNSHSLLNRGKSVSNEDLTVEHDADDDVEPIEWRRVSKIRRSLQLPKTSTPRNSYSRPPDLPEYSVSVSKIKEELENGRRLNTAMRNNHVDLVALDNILNGVSDKGIKTDQKYSKKTTFITAESLKEIRGKLKRLSDESLYKDDMSQCDDQEEHKEPLNNADSIKINETIATEGIQTCLQNYSHNSKNINTNQCIRETRSKVKDTSSSDWYSRRKSYGFEKMTPSPDSSSKMLESTDSGIGRSAELTNLWSPTESSPKGTIVSLGENNLKHNNSSTYITLLNGTHDIKQTQFSPYKQTDDEAKRHSIAVDEAKYVRDNLRRVFETKTSVHLNGMYSDDSSQNNSDDKDGRRSKRVEFCKTEVHFAAESGRVNIVETDGKPPPTNNFRRRRRVTSSSSNIGASFLEAINSGVPVTHFGDIEKKTKDEFLPTSTNVTTSIVKTSNFFSEIANVKKEEEEQLDETSIRGILKNKPVTPKKFFLGENIDSGESLWGVRLRPVTNDFRNWRSSSGIEDDNDAINETDLSTLNSQNTDDHLKYKNDVPEHETTSTSKLSLLSNSSNFSWQNKEYKFTSGKSDVVHSNVLSIALHSPTSMTKSYPTKHPPIAMPRTPVKTTRQNETNVKISRKINTSEKKEEENKNVTTKLTSGTRKLREHELSYFGIGPSKSPSDFGQSISPNNQTSKLSINRSVTPTKLDQLLTKMSKRNKWQLSNDKPDLLRHSPSVEKTSDYRQVKSENIKSSKIGQTHEEPIYENLRKSSSVYNRKNDLKRDEMILTELSKAADQILNTVAVTTNDDEEMKKLSPKIRLQTIEENKSTQKIMQSKGVQVSRGFSDSLRRRHRTSRVSSESSNESVSRGSSAVQKVSGGSTKRLCSKTHETVIRPASVTSSNKSSRRRVVSSANSHRMQRTSSRDTLNSHASSSEDLPNSTDVVLPRRRMRPKEKSDSQQSSIIVRSDSNQRNSSVRTGTDRSSSKKSHRSDNSTHASKGGNLTEQQSKTRVRSGVQTTTSSPRRSSSRQPDGIWK